MKKYNRPSIEVVDFDVESIITLSVGLSGSESGDFTEWSIDTEEYYVDATDSYKR